MGDRYPMGPCNIDMFHGLPDRPPISRPAGRTIALHLGRTNLTEEDDAWNMKQS